jgi:hypothetical protein
MKHVLRKYVAGDIPEVEITAEEYAELKEARKILSNALAIEEKYEILIRNYLDFERQVLDIVITNMVRSRSGYSDFFEVRLSLNVRLVNLLTAARLYVDQLNQNVRECVPTVTDIKDRVKALFAKEYDEHKEYRFMEALRNYVQHRGLPVHSTQLGSRWTSLDDNGLIEFSMDLASDFAYLEENGGFKKAILDEWDGKIDLKVTTRKYVESLSQVHESTRTMIAESATAARKLIEDAQHRYSINWVESLVGLSICEISDDGKYSALPLLLDWDDIRLVLQNRNKTLVNLSKSYVTSSVKIP